MFISHHDDFVDYFVYILRLDLIGAFGIVKKQCKLIIGMTNIVVHDSPPSNSLFHVVMIRCIIKFRLIMPIYFIIVNIV